MDRLVAMETYVRVVQGESFSKAAEYLNISSGLVTRRIAKLEQMLGTRLLTRTTRSLHVTPSGRAYYNFCQRILEEIRQAEARVAVGHQQESGEISILAPKSFGSICVTEAVAQFMDEYPEINVSLILSDISPRSFNLVERGFDYAIRVAPMTDSSFVSRTIAPIKWHVYAAPSYLDRHGEPKELEDLSRHRCIWSIKATPDGIWTLRGNTVDVSATTRMRTNSVVVLKQMVVAGHGIALLPRFYAEPDVAAGGLKPILADFPPPDSYIHGVFPHGQLIPRRVRIFADFMAIHLKEKVSARP